MWTLDQTRVAIPRTNFVSRDIVAIHVTAGQRHESKAFEPTMARRLVHRRRGQRRWPRRLAADKGDSYPRIRRWCRRRRIEATIPTRSNQPRDEHFDKATYRQRHIIEQVVGWYKEYRGLGTRHEKLAVNYVALWLVAIMDKALHRPTIATVRVISKYFYF